MNEARTTRPGGASTERPAWPDELCTCGRRAAVVFMTEEHGEVGYCGAQGAREAGAEDLPRTVGDAMSRLRRTSGVTCVAIDSAGRISAAVDGVTVGPLRLGVWRLVLGGLAADELPVDLELVRRAIAGAIDQPGERVDVDNGHVLEDVGGRLVMNRGDVDEVSADVDRWKAAASAGELEVNTWGDLLMAVSS